ncbi:MAG: hypothetical protein II269_02040 [Bacteroidaceae bacterium]|nr:hypothetical protein [Bacteroidaceae bacterium]
MKRLINNTLKMLQAGEAKKAIEFCTKSVRYRGEDEMLLREIRALYRKYPKTSDEERIHLSMMSSMLYDLLSLGKGRQSSLLCLSPAGLAEEVCLSLGSSESIFYALGGTTKKLVLPTDVDDTPDEHIKKYFTADSYVRCISRKHNIHCYRDGAGALVLAGVIPVKSAVLVDEEMFADEEPLYFTESTHFVSPVYLLDRAEILIKELLQIVGYPHLRIRHIVVYDGGADCYPINEDDMWESDTQWLGRDLDNLIINRTPGRVPIEGMGREEYPTSLLEVLQVACQHYDQLEQIGPRYMERDIHEYVKKQVKLT